MTKIAVLGWGSLIWCPKREAAELSLATGDWFLDGPLLPVEFARISCDGTLTLVLLPGSEKVQVLWAQMAEDDLERAVENLRIVEGIPESARHRIGFVDLRSGKQRSQGSSVSVIRLWADRRKVDAVIWTDLLPNFKERERAEFTERNVIEYLRNRPNDIKEKAEQYIRRAPRQIRTQFRSAIERELGWTPVD